MAQPSRFVLTRAKEEPSDLEPIFDPKIDPMKLPWSIDRAVSLGLAPISGINVGAAGLGSSGDVIFLGVNVELPDLPLQHSIHAVQFLVTNLALNSERHLTYLAVSADNSVCGAPCGHCRQFLQEIREAPKIQILIKEKDENEYVSLESLLPRPNNLLPEDYSHLLQWRYNDLTLLDPDSAGDICGDSDDDDRCTHFKCRALAAANKSYAPYRKCPSGVALRDCDGEVYRGWYMESVAYNPSLGPVQAALVDFVARSRGKGFDKIVEALLVEKKDPKVRQEDTARMILEKIARRDCVFSVLHCSEPAKP